MMLLLITCDLNMLKMQGLIQNIAFVLLIDMVMLTQFQILVPFPRAAGHIFLEFPSSSSCFLDLPVLVSQSCFTKFSLYYSTLIIPLASFVLSVPLVIAGTAILYFSEFYAET